MSSNPIVESIRSGQAPRVARLAAARGVLPLGAEETLEILISLDGDEDDEIRTTAGQTLDGYTSARLRPIIDNPDAPPRVLSFLASWKGLPRDLYQPVILHPATSDEALAGLASTSDSGEIIEIISLKQQSLIRYPAIIDAILRNPRRTPDADRRAREIRQEFFEKEFGAQVIAEEQRAQATAEAAAPAVAPDEIVFYEDVAQFIEADLIETGDALFEQFEEVFGPIDEMPGLSDETLDFEALFASEAFPADLKEEAPERITVLARITKMTVKERIRFALKGTREVRMILIRDPNRPVCAAVISNPRITLAEVEAIANLRGVNEEVLRLIGSNRAWIKSYHVIHNLVRNPKTPVQITLGLLNRIQNRDLRELGKNKNVTEVIRTMAGRLYLKRQTG